MKRLSVVLVVIALLIVSAPGLLAQDDGEYTWEGDAPAPEFPADADWINVSAPLQLEDLRGKIVLLDFWTYGCINCIHIIPDLKRLEAEYAEELVVVGVHSAKFDNEGQTENIRRIVRRYEVEHPVLNDNAFLTWRAYDVRAWPTVVVIDPFGKYVGSLSGEPLYERIQPIIDTMAREYRAADVLNLEPLPQWQPEDMASDTPLRFPGKVLADPASNRLFIADSNHNRIVVTALDSYEVQDVIGGRAAGWQDGDFAAAQFFRPQGMTLVENVLYVADTGNHSIRAVDFDARTVATVAGTGQQGYERDASGPGQQMALNSPWDLVAHDGTLYIAMAGPHQLWAYDIASGEIGPYAGSGREALTDGQLRQAALNQPSGIDTDGEVLFFADAEASAIRTADLDPDGAVNTIVGTGLFDFGDRDGTGDDVLLQHPLGIAVAGDGSLYIADTYNNKIKRIDPQTRESVTFLGSGEPGLADGDAPQFYEPGGLDVAGGKLYIADTNNHAVRVVDLDAGTVSTVVFPNAARLLPEPDQAGTPGDAASGDDGAAFDLGPGPGSDDDDANNNVTLPPQVVAPGEGTIRVEITMPDGYKINDLAPFVATWPDDPVAQIPPDAQNMRVRGPKLPLEVPVTFSPGETELYAELTVPWCEAVNETLCFLADVTFTAPLTVSADGDSSTLTLSHHLIPPVIDDNSFD
jgi:thiol-disulfide isomerase/thioredoxin/sugar lactone lactonase YvrE